MTGRGLDQARDAGQRSSSRFPRLRLQAGDRARFHFLSEGKDEFFAGSRFHLYKEQTRTGKTYSREVLCLRSFTDGDEVCPSCEEGHDTTGMKMAVWIWLHLILHLGDNPDAEADPWEQVQMKGADGKKGRIVFKETVDQPLIIWMGYGKEYAWFEQFDAAYNQYGGLENHMYELKRAGSGMTDTDYTLSAIKKGKLPKASKDAGHEKRVSIGEVFQETLAGGQSSPKPTRLSDQLDEGDTPGEAEGEMPSEDPPEEQELPEMEEPEGSLI